MIIFSNYFSTSHPVTIQKSKLDVAGDTLQAAAASCRYHLPNKGCTKQEKIKGQFFEYSSRSSFIQDTNTVREMFNVNIGLPLNSLEIYSHAVIASLYLI